MASQQNMQKERPSLILEAHACSEVMQRGTSIDGFAAKFGFAPRPFVPMSRYRDNIYLVFSNILSPILTVVELAYAARLRMVP